MSSYIHFISSYKHTIQDFLHMTLTSHFKDTKHLVIILCNTITFTMKTINQIIIQDYAQLKREREGYPPLSLLFTMHEDFCIDILHILDYQKETYTIPFQESQKKPRREIKMEFTLKFSFQVSMKRGMRRELEEDMVAFGSLSERFLPRSSSSLMSVCDLLLLFLARNLLFFLCGQNRLVSRHSHVHRKGKE